MARSLDEALGQVEDCDIVLVDAADVVSLAAELRKHTGAPIVAVLRADTAPLALTTHADELLPEADLGPALLERTLRLCDTTSDFGRRIEFLSQRDVLTGLPNQRLFERQLELALSSAERHQRHLAVAALGLDRFQAIAADMGQSATETLLIAVADRLAGALRRSDLVARAQGDSFLLMLEVASDPGDVAATAEKLLTLLREPFTFGDRSLQLTASMGIALFPSAGRGASALLAEARLALGRVQSDGGDDFRFRDRALELVSRERLHIEGALPGAIERGEFSVCYQPRLDLSTMRITGAEVLARWHSPSFGEVSPERFIPIAEETGAIVRLGEWILDRALEDFTRWHAAGHRLRLGVNVSAAQFSSKHFAARVERALGTRGLPASALELEITERLLVQHDADQGRSFHALADLGIAFAVDDFGVGYSSLAYLKHFPLHALKIDRSFVDPLPESRRDAAIIRAIVALGHALGLRVVAEGVESAAQLEFLHGAGCDEAQGFFIGRGADAAAFGALLDEETRAGRKPDSTR